MRNSFDDMTERQIEHFFGERAVSTEGTYAVAYAVLQLADAVNSVAAQISRLGTNDANTPMGAIELLSSEIKRIADAMETWGDERCQA